MKKCDVLVVGGGISGMSFAHYASKANLNIAVIEKENRIGGSFHSAKFKNSSNDFWIELGAHTCYNSYRNLIEVMEDCGVIDDILPRAKVPFRLLKGQQIKSFPSQINFLELLISIPRLFTGKKEGKTVKSYYGSIVGRKNFDNVFSALFSAVPSQNADEFPADALFKKRERRKDILKHYAMKNGLGSITEAIAKNDRVEILYGTEPKKIDKSKAGYSVQTNNGIVHGTRLAVCTSIASVPGMIEGIHPAVADKIARIKFQKIESFGVIVSSDITDIKPFAGLVPVDDVFFSVVSRDTLPDKNYRGFTFHFKPDILSVEQKLEKVSNVLGITDDQIIETFEKLNIVPSLRLGHYDLVHEIDHLLKGGSLFLSGNYFAGLSIEDCVSRSKAEVERMVKGE